MNEVWVPSEFSREVFAASGVEPAKLRVVGGGCLPLGGRAAGKGRVRPCAAQLRAAAAAAGASGMLPQEPEPRRLLACNAGARGREHDFL
jgi:hypothetical protein